MEPARAEAPALVPARMINETLYCERLTYLEWVQGEFADNEYTVEGRYAHRRADAPGGTLPAPSDAEERPYRARSVWLSSERLGITAKIDIVESEDGSSVIPIEYKRGAPPDVPEGAWLPERAQLCAQVLLLREHGYRCDEAALYFARARKRVAIRIDEALIETTLAAAARARALSQTGVLPPPLVDSPKCAGCSLVNICLPDETNLLRAETHKTGELRQLHPLRDDQLPLYAIGQGTRIGVSGECLNIRDRDGATTEARLPDLAHVAVFGHVQISTQALRALFEREIPVAYCSTGGWLYGRTVPLSSKNVELRLTQMRAALDPEICLRLARRFVSVKIRNCRTMLRRNGEGVPDAALAELERLADRVDKMSSLSSLLGLEGTAARLYFAHFGKMLKAKFGDFDFDGRNRRPPRDPINALLSFAYSLLVKDFVLAASQVGFDPMLGFYHQLKFGRPALALDVMEEFRPLVADSVVIGAVNSGLVGENDFVRSPVGVALTTEGRRSFVQAYERRMDQLVTHPVFGYRVSYRRILEVQMRLLVRHLTGEIDQYPEFRTR